MVLPSAAQHSAHQGFAVEFCLIVVAVAVVLVLRDAVGVLRASKMRWVGMSITLFVSHAVGKHTAKNYPTGCEATGIFQARLFFHAPARDYRICEAGTRVSLHLQFAVAGILFRFVPFS